MKRTITILSICFLMIGGFSFAAESGPVNPAPFPGVGKASPMVQSKFFVMEALVKDGSASMVLPIDTPQKAVAMVLGESAARAFTASRQPLEAIYFEEEEMKRINLPSANTRFNLDLLSPGQQLITLHDIQDAKYVRMVIAQPESSLGLMVQVVPLAARCREKVTVTAQIHDEQLTREASVEAVLPNGKSFTLHDNGLDGDLAADDGVYTGTFTAPGIQGCQGVNIRFTAKGKRSDGTEFLRNAINMVMVTDAKGKIFKNRISVEPDGIIVPLKGAEGRYRVEIIFGFNETSLAYSRENITQAGEPRSVRLPLPGVARAANRAVVRLLNKDTLGLEDEFEITLTPTQAPPDFEAIPAQTQQMPYSKIKAAQKIKHDEENDPPIHH